MQKRMLDNRDAIELLVNSFYSRVQRDDLLAPIFTNVEFFKWDVHIPVMVNFWETVLLDAATYKGNTMQKHISLHQKTPLTSELFNRWKELFYATLDEHFEGPGVTEAHRRVEAMSGLMQYKIEQSDKKGFVQ